MSAAVYRLFDRNGALLYVGVTEDIKTRLSDHRYTKPWWSLVDPSRTSAQQFPDRSLADAAEVDAIRDELPRYNIVGVDGRYFAQSVVELAPHHQAIAERLIAIGDPGERARQAAAEMDAARAEGTRLTELRIQAIREMQTAGLSVLQVAHALGLHRDRVYRILRSAT